MELYKNMVLSRSIAHFRINTELMVLRDNEPKSKRTAALMQFEKFLSFLFSFFSPPRSLPSIDEQYYGFTLYMSYYFVYFSCNTCLFAVFTQKTITAKMMWNLSSSIHVPSSFVLLPSRLWIVRVLTEKDISACHHTHISHNSHH